MEDRQQRSTQKLSGRGGPREKGGGAPTKPRPVSSSPGEGGNKRPAQYHDDDDDDDVVVTALPAPPTSSSSGPAPPSSSGGPPAAKISKMAFGLISPPVKKPAPISIKLGASKPKEVVPSLPAKKPALASVFNDDSDESDPEEMPPEAKMRMKNIGRETPTSAGPNSFNKGKQGFSDHQKLWERKLKTHTDQ